MYNVHCVIPTIYFIDCNTVLICIDYEMKASMFILRETYRESDYNIAISIP